ncbi:fasciclin domain-containing protein [Candidatus Babeliales bacterium]|nr:fasciclin domain-containing protein [Candidatus Babeliales bacterium]
MKKLFLLSLLILPAFLKAQKLGDVMEEASKAGLFAFVKSVATAELTESAKQTEAPAPFTVFVPSNTAFAKANMSQTLEVLRPRIMYHVIPGFNLPKSQLKGKLESIAGSYVSITADGKVQGAKEKANIEKSILCSNGIIHVIDKVLTPTEDEDDD